MYIMYVHCDQKSPAFYFWNNSFKNKPISINFSAQDSWGKFTLADYKFAHFTVFTLKMSPHLPSEMQKSRFATTAGWDMAWVPAERGGSLTSGEQDSKLVFRETVVISNSACDVCGTIFQTIQQPVLFRATHFFPKKTVD